MFLQQQSWIMDIIRMILACLDFLVYSLAKWIMYITFDLSNLTANSELLNTIYHRIYLILAIFMAFKLSFSFFKYLVSPESMRDDKKGVAALFKNVMLMLGGLIAIPTLLFGTSGGEGLLTRAQRAFLPMVPRLILGINTGNEGATASDDSLEQAAEEMAVAALQAFFTPATEGEGEENIQSRCVEGNKAKNTPPITKVSDLPLLVNQTCRSGFSIKILGFNIGAPRYYYYSYTYVVSLIVGIILDVSLLGLCIDVAKRVFKLIILQIIAPIPIMSLIDPAAMTDKGRFRKWLNMLISTYLELFIKLGILYTVILLIQQIITHGLFNNFPSFSEHPIRAALLTVALIIGLFQFAREAPKFIQEALGLQAGDGGGMMGKFAKGLGGATAGLAGGALHGNALAGAVSGAQASYNAKPGESGKAFHKGAETAAKISTGDSKREVGFGASMMRFAGGRRGYSQRGYQDVKGRADADLARANAAELTASSAQADAARADEVAANRKSQLETAQRGASAAEALYTAFSSSGQDFATWASKQSVSTRSQLAANGVTDNASFNSYVANQNRIAKGAATAYSNAQRDANDRHEAARTAQAAASQARKTSDASSKAEEKYKTQMGQYGVSAGRERGAVGALGQAGYRAGRTIHAGVDVAVDAVENVRVVGVARTIDSAVQQHVANQIATGQRANNVVQVGTETLSDGSTVGVYESESSHVIAERDRLDSMGGGTAQSRFRDFEDSVNPGGDHDGHHGPAGHH